MEHDGGITPPNGNTALSRNGFDNPNDLEEIYSSDSSQQAGESTEGLEEDGEDEEGSGSESYWSSEGDRENSNSNHQKYYREDPFQCVMEQERYMGASHKDPYVSLNTNYQHVSLDEGKDIDIYNSQDVRQHKDEHTITSGSMGFLDNDDENFVNFPGRVDYDCHINNGAQDTSTNSSSYYSKSEKNQNSHNSSTNDDDIFDPNKLPDSKKRCAADRPKTAHHSRNRRLSTGAVSADNGNIKHDMSFDRISHEGKGTNESFGECDKTPEEINGDNECSPAHSSSNSNGTIFELLNLRREGSTALGTAEISVVDATELEEHLEVTTRCMDNYTAHYRSFYTDIKAEGDGEMQEDNIKKYKSTLSFKMLGTPLRESILLASVREVVAEERKERNHMDVQDKPLLSELLMATKTRFALIARHKLDRIRSCALATNPPTLSHNKHCDSLHSRVASSFHFHIYDEAMIDSHCRLIVQGVSLPTYEGFMVIQSADSAAKRENGSNSNDISGDIISPKQLLLSSTLRGKDGISSKLPPIPSFSFADIFGIIAAQKCDRAGRNHFTLNPREVIFLTKFVAVGMHSFVDDGEVYKDNNVHSPIIHGNLSVTNLFLGIEADTSVSMSDVKGRSGVKPIVHVTDPLQGFTYPMIAPDCSHFSLNHLRWIEKHVVGPSVQIIASKKRDANSEQRDNDILNVMPSLEEELFCRYEEAFTESSKFSGYTLRQKDDVSALGAIVYHGIMGHPYRCGLTVAEAAVFEAERDKSNKVDTIESSESVEHIITATTSCPIFAADKCFKDVRFCSLKTAFAIKYEEFRDHYHRTNSYCRNYGEKETATDDSEDHVLVYKLFLEQALDFIYQTLLLDEGIDGNTMSHTIPPIMTLSDALSHPFLSTPTGSTGSSYDDNFMNVLISVHERVFSGAHTIWQNAGSNPVNMRLFRNQISNSSVQAFAGKTGFEKSSHTLEDESIFEVVSNEVEKLGTSLSCNKTSASMTVGTCTTELETMLEEAKEILSWTEKKLQQHLPVYNRQGDVDECPAVVRIDISSSSLVICNIGDHVKDKDVASSSERECSVGSSDKGIDWTLTEEELGVIENTATMVMWSRYYVKEVERVKCLISEKKAHMFESGNERDDHQKINTLFSKNTHTLLSESDLSDEAELRRQKEKLNQIKYAMAQGAYANSKNSSDLSISQKEQFSSPREEIHAEVDGACTLTLARKLLEELALHRESLISNLKSTTHQCNQQRYSNDVTPISLSSTLESSVRSSFKYLRQAISHKLNSDYVNLNKTGFKLHHIVIKNVHFSSFAFLFPVIGGAVVDTVSHSRIIFGPTAATLCRNISKCEPFAVASRVLFLEGDILDSIFSIHLAENPKCGGNVQWNLKKVKTMLMSCNVEEINSNALIRLLDRIDEGEDDGDCEESSKGDLTSINSKDLSILKEQSKAGNTKLLRYIPGGSCVQGVEFIPYLVSYPNLTKHFKNLGLYFEAAHTMLKFPSDTPLSQRQPSTESTEITKERQLYDLFAPRLSNQCTGLTKGHISPRERDGYFGTESSFVSHYDINNRRSFFSVVDSYITSLPSLVGPPLSDFPYLYSISHGMTYRHSNCTGDLTLLPGEVTNWVIEVSDVHGGFIPSIGKNRCVPCVSKERPATTDLSDIYSIIERNSVPSFRADIALQLLLKLCACSSSQPNGIHNSPTPGNGISEMMNCTDNLGNFSSFTGELSDILHSTAEGYSINKDDENNSTFIFPRGEKEALTHRYQSPVLLILDTIEAASFTNVSYSTIIIAASSTFVTFTNVSHCKIYVIAKESVTFAGVCHHLEVYGYCSLQKVTLDGTMSSTMPSNKTKKNNYKFSHLQICPLLLEAPLLDRILVDAGIAASNDETDLRIDKSTDIEGQENTITTLIYPNQFVAGASSVEDLNIVLHSYSSEATSEMTIKSLFDLRTIAVVDTVICVATIEVPYYPDSSSSKVFSSTSAQGGEFCMPRVPITMFLDPMLGSSFPNSDSTCIEMHRDDVSSHGPILHVADVCIHSLTDCSILRMEGAISPLRNPSTAPPPSRVLISESTGEARTVGTMGSFMFPAEVTLTIANVNGGVIHISEAVDVLYITNCSGPLDIIVAAAQTVLIFGCDNITVQTSCFEFVVYDSHHCHFALHCNSQPKIIGASSCPVYDDLATFSIPIPDFQSSSSSEPELYPQIRARNEKDTAALQKYVERSLLGGALLSSIAKCSNLKFSPLNITCEGFFRNIITKGTTDEDNVSDSATGHEYHSYTMTFLERASISEDINLYDRPIELDLRNGLPDDVVFGNAFLDQLLLPSDILRMKSLSKDIKSSIMDAVQLEIASEYTKDKVEGQLTPFLVVKMDNSLLSSPLTPHLATQRHVSHWMRHSIATILTLDPFCYDGTVLSVKTKERRTALEKAANLLLKSLNIEKSVFNEAVGTTDISVANGTCWSLVPPLQPTVLGKKDDMQSQISDDGEEENITIRFPDFIKLAVQRELKILHGWSEEGTKTQNCNVRSAPNTYSSSENQQHLLKLSETSLLMMDDMSNNLDMIDESISSSNADEDYDDVPSTSCAKKNYNSSYSLMKLQSQYISQLNMIGRSRAVVKLLALFRSIAFDGTEQLTQHVCDNVNDRSVEFKECQEILIWAYWQSLLLDCQSHHQRQRHDQSLGNMYDVMSTGMCRFLASSYEASMGDPTDEGHQYTLRWLLQQLTPITTVSYSREENRSEIINGSSNNIESVLCSGNKSPLNLYFALDWKSQETHANNTEGHVMESESTLMTNQLMEALNILDPTQPDRYGVIRGDDGSSDSSGENIETRCSLSIFPDVCDNTIDVGETRDSTSEESSVVNDVVSTLDETHNIVEHDNENIQINASNDESHTNNDRMKVFMDDAHSDTNYEVILKRCHEGGNNRCSSSSNRDEVCEDTIEEESTFSPEVSENTKGDPVDMTTSSTLTGERNDNDTSFKSDSDVSTEKECLHSKESECQHTSERQHTSQSPIVDSDEGNSALTSIGHEEKGRVYKNTLFSYKDYKDITDSNWSPEKESFVYPQTQDTSFVTYDTENLPPPSSDPESEGSSGSYGHETSIKWKRIKSALLFRVRSSPITLTPKKVEMTTYNHQATFIQIRAAHKAQQQKKKELQERHQSVYEALCKHL